MSAGEWIKEERQARGWSQSELSFRSHVSARLIWRYENGEGIPSTTNLTKIADAFGVALPWSGASGDSSTARERTLAMLGIPFSPLDLGSLALAEEHYELPQPPVLTVVQNHG